MENISVYSHMSRSEKKVANFLKETGIFWSYEKPVYIWDENKRPRVWTPDFYLIPFGIYVEVCGSEKFDYDYRKRIFDSNGYIVIFLHLYKEPDKWKNHLMSYLEKIMDYRYRKFNKMIRKEN